jgi:hypothetical protein
MLERRSDMRIRKSLITAILLVALLAFTATVALAQDPLPPTEEPTPEETTEPEERQPGQNPVAWFLSQYFQESEFVEWGETEPTEGELPEGELPEGELPEGEGEESFDLYEYIMELHEDYGFGNLARAFYLFSQVSNPAFFGEGDEIPEFLTGIESFEDLLALRADYGWGVLYKELGLPRNEGSLGWAFKNAETAEKPGNGNQKWATAPDETEETGDADTSGGTELTSSSGNSNNNGNGNGNGKPDNPGNSNNSGKPDNAGPKDKKTKDK